MKIAMVSEHASPLAVLGGDDAGGQNVHVAALASALADRGHTVEVFTRRDAPGLPEVVQLHPGVNVVHVPAGPARAIGKDSLPPYMPAFGSWLAARWRRTGRPDVVHAHFWMSGVAALRARASTGTPLVQTFHALGVVKRRHQGDADTSPPDRLAREEHLARAADAVIATCSDEVRELLALGARPDRLHVAPCGVDLDAFRSGPSPRVLRPMRRVVSIGRLVERKGVRTLIEALPLVLLEHPDTELVVAGGPDERELDGDPHVRLLRAAAAELGVADRVRFVGRVGRADVPALMRSADVVACVPWYEPFGIVPAGGDGVRGAGRRRRGGRPARQCRRRGHRVARAAARPGRHRGGPEPCAGRRESRLRLGRAAAEHVATRFGWPRVAELTETVYTQLADAPLHGRRSSRSGRSCRRKGTGMSHAFADLHRHLPLLRRALTTSSGRPGRWRAGASGSPASSGDGGRLIAAGNGGSAAEAQHLTAELVGRFETPDRRPLSAIALSARDVEPDGHRQRLRLRARLRATGHARTAARATCSCCSPPAAAARTSSRRPGRAARPAWRSGR